MVLRHCIWACRYGKLDIVRYLLTRTHGANLEAIDNDGKTPLHYACNSDMDDQHCDEVVQFLLDAEAELFSVTNNGETAFDMVAVRRENAIEYLLQAYAGKVTQREARQPLHAILQLATYSNVAEHPRLTLSLLLRMHLPLGKLTVEHFQTLLQMFPDESIRSLDHRGNTPLHVACRFKAPVDILRLLVQANPDALSTADDTEALPLHVACRSNVSIDDIQFLVERYPDAVRELNNDGALPLHLLCGATPPVQTVKYLVKCFEGSVATKTKLGKLPLVVACESSASESVIQVLLTEYPDALELEHMQAHDSSIDATGTQRKRKRE